MTDEYLTIKIDFGLLMRKLEEWKIQQMKKQINDMDTDIMFSASLNETKSSDDKRPLYRGKGIAVWHNKADVEQQ